MESKGFQHSFQYHARLIPPPPLQVNVSVSFHVFINTVQEFYQDVLMGNRSRFPVRGNGLASDGAVELRTLHAPCGALACGWSLTGWLGWEVSEVSVYARWGWCYALRGHGLSVLFETQRP